MKSKKGQPKHDFDELDVYEAVRSLGEHENGKSGLKNEQLAMLLDSGRLAWEMLSDKEKRSIEEDVGYGDRVKLWKGSRNGDVQPGPKKIDERAARMSKTITTTLFNDLEKMGEQKLGERWTGFSEEEKEETMRYLFWTYYGSSPEFYRVKLYLGLVKRG